MLIVLTKKVKQGTQLTWPYHADFEDDGSETIQDDANSFSSPSQPVSQTQPETAGDSNSGGGDSW